MRWWRRKERERELDRELRSDLELEAAEQRESGLSEEEARYAAQRAFGNTTFVKEEMRAARGWTWIGSCVQDLRFGSRILAKSPGITPAVILSLALGLGATTALFSLLNSLLFKALPVPEPERLIVLSHGRAAEMETIFSYPQLAALRDESKGAADLFGYAGGGESRLQFANLDRKVQVQLLSGDAFRILKIAPFLGRLLDAADDARGSGSAPVVVIGYRFWKSAFHGEPSVIGRKVLIDSVPFLVVGVTPPSFYGVSVGGYADITLPFVSEQALNPQSTMLDCKNCYWLNIIGRLKPRVDARTAVARLDVAWKNVLRAAMPENLPERYKGEYFAERIALNPGGSGLSGLRDRFTNPLYVLLAMTGVILLIACSNVANLLTARALARRRELAVRLSIGAGRGRLVRQLLTESALLAGASLVAGIAVNLACVRGLLWFLSSGGENVYLDTSPDWRVAAFVTASALLTLALFGLSPALRATRCRLNGALAEGSQSVTGRSSFGRPVLCAQLALSFSLLVAAILLARTLHDLRTFHAGFRRDHLLLISPDTTRAIPNYSDLLRYGEAVLADVRNLSGVRSASASVVVPMNGSSWQNDFTTPGYIARRGSGSSCYENFVTPDFFQTMGTRLLSGREFTERDDDAGPKVAVVNEALARRYWGNESPLGKRILDVGKKEPLTVVGVVEDAKYRDFRKAAPPTVYVPLRQIPSTVGWNLNLEVWASGDPHSLIRPAHDVLNRQLKDIDTKFQTFAEMIDEGILYERLLTALSISFGGLAVLICAIGIYGIAAYSVNRRTAEIGIRMALGATPGEVLRLVFREQAVPVCAGLCAGAAGALGFTRFLRTWLFGVSPTDVPSLVAGMLFLAGITAIAVAIPARRAAGIEPLRALRHE